jgi:hypothetical protein
MEQTPKPTAIVNGEIKPSDADSSAINKDQYRLAFFSKPIADSGKQNYYISFMAIGNTYKKSYYFAFDVWSVLLYSNQSSFIYVYIYI